LFPLQQLSIFLVFHFWSSKPRNRINISKFAHAQDGLLRVFHYDSMELVGAARSYFGGLLCAAWSPDGKYIVAGGEDDLVTVYRYQE
jgi:hypothetical protein